MKMAAHKVRLVLGSLLLAGILAVNAKLAKIKKKSKGFVPALPSSTQAKWLDYEVGASIHFNMQTFARNMSRGTAFRTKY